MGTERSKSKRGKKSPNQRARSKVRKQQSARFVRTELLTNAPTMATSRQAAKAVLPEMRPRNRVKPGKLAKGQKKLVKQISGPGEKKLRSNLANFLRALQDPFNAGFGVRCPVNYNPVPTFQSSVAHTTHTNNAFTVAATTSSEYVIFPGHQTQSDADSMDGVSYHSSYMTVDATQRLIGPVSDGIYIPAIGFRAVGLALGVSAVASNVAGYAALMWDQSLPYTSSAGNGYHTRWKLVSMGMRIENTTPIGSRGGNVLWCQPASNINYATIAAYTTDPTFGESSKANIDVLEINWTPRAQDLAYWHIDTTLASDNSATGAGMHVWVQNPTATAQNYSIQIVCNWEIAGQNLVSISSPGIHQPADRNIVEPALEVTKFQNTGSKGMFEIGTAVAHAASGFEIPPRLAAAAQAHIAAGAAHVLQSLIG